MNICLENEIDKNQAINKVCDFFSIDKSLINRENLTDIIKELCTLRLAKAIGLTIRLDKSAFFNFFANIMGEAVCQKLEINLRIASDDLRLIRYDNINLVGEMKHYLDTEGVEEAFLDAYNLADRFKYLVKY
ncbi:MAG: hypothetical protein IJW36_01130 [Clostridia bacterium]|nr:hypothetical protein [Clostridia bacterium]